MTRGLSQECLAERAGLHTNTIGLLERGLRQPSLYTVFQLAQALNVSPTDFIQNLADKHPKIHTQTNVF